MTEVIDEYSEKLANKFRQENQNRETWQNYINNGIDLTAYATAYGTGGLAPFVMSAGELLKWGYSTIWDDIELTKQDEERKKHFKEGVWYKNKNSARDLEMAGGASTKAVPLAPKNTGNKIIYDKGISYNVDNQNKMPLVPIMPITSHGWSHNYEPQIPVVPVDVTKGKINLHPKKTMNPNATMPPSGGFSGRDNTVVPVMGFSNRRRRRLTKK